MSMLDEVRSFLRFYYDEILLNGQGRQITPMSPSPINTILLYISPPASTFGETSDTSLRSYAIGL
ncbi:Protein of unknown function [Pyronema omphalodes CBS 100304]|uniref:Uncharacterized protein n=1 Tax=Pyronema omphalodes (strain CBS 100304) TaxID=1076935 RepID=U4LY64_PYROM|nr:Protein of unknown function [Pyronema omphalodes CBS 100304]